MLRGHFKVTTKRERCLCFTEIFDTDYGTALELWAVKLDRVEFVVAIDNGEVGIRAADTNTQLDHFEL